MGRRQQAGAEHRRVQPARARRARGQAAAGRAAVGRAPSPSASMSMRAASASPDPNMLCLLRGRRQQWRGMRQAGETTACRRRASIVPSRRCHRWSLSRYRSDRKRVGMLGTAKDPRGFQVGRGRQVVAAHSTARCRRSPPQVPHDGVALADITLLVHIPAGGGRVGVERASRPPRGCGTVPSSGRGITASQRR